MKRMLALLAALAAVQAASAEPAIPPPRDVAYPGTVRLDVDATDLDHRVFQVRETVPVAGAGPLVLLYPKWLPGNHSSTGPIEQLAGLMITGRPAGIRLECDSVGDCPNGEQCCGAFNGTAYDGVACSPFCSNGFNEPIICEVGAPLACPAPYTMCIPSNYLPTGYGHCG